MTKYKKAEWRNNERNLPDGSYIDNDDDICHIKNGEKHREDGPAIECADGRKEWWVSGKKHREDGPAVEGADGRKEWWVSGKRYREDGPAIEYVNGDKAWYKNGKLHREDGPAVEFADGTKKWFINGEECSEKDYEEAIKIWKMNEAMR